MRVKTVNATSGMRRKPAGIEISDLMSGMQRQMSTAERDLRSNHSSARSRSVSPKPIQVP